MPLHLPSITQKCITPAAPTVPPTSLPRLAATAVQSSHPLTLFPFLSGPTVPLQPALEAPLLQGLWAVLCKYPACALRTPFSQHSTPSLALPRQAPPTGGDGWRLGDVRLVEASQPFQGGRLLGEVVKMAPAQRRKSLCPPLRGIGRPVIPLLPD